jgi:hypothetical protein
MKRNEETEEGKGRKEGEMKGGDHGKKGIMRSTNIFYTTLASST